MRKVYKLRRNRVLSAMEACPYAPILTIREENAGLHFLVSVRGEISDEELVRRCAEAGIRVRSLGSYYHGPIPEEDRRCLVVNYSGLREEQIDLLAEKLKTL